MSGVSITIDDSQVEDVLAKLLAAAGDLSPVLKNIGEYEAQSTKNRIVKGISPDGSAFAPLNPLYAKVEKKGPGILRGATGRLAEIVYQVGGDTVAIGNDIVYGAIHQFGGVIKAKNAPALIFSLGGRKVQVKSVSIPARPYLGLSTEDQAEILAIVADHFILATGGELDGP